MNLLPPALCFASLLPHRALAIHSQMDTTTDFGTVRYLPSTPEFDVVVLSIEVLPQLRRQGICTRFFRHLQEDCQRGVLVCGVGSEWVLRCLLRLGFRDSGGDLWWIKPPPSSVINQ